MADKLAMDKNGYVFADGAKVCQIRNGRIVFHDKDRRRASGRGTTEVIIEVSSFVAYVTKDETSPED